MSFIADGVLIVTCLTTALYCYVLSRRLQKLLNTDEGIGQQIQHLNTAIAETGQALQDIRLTTKESTDRLSSETARAKKELAALTRKIDEAGQAALRIEEALKTAASYPAEPVEPARTAPKEPEFSDEDDELDDVVAEIEDEDLDDDGEDLSDVLKEPLGQQQLGFLPEPADLGSDDAPDGELEPAGAAPKRPSKSPRKKRAPVEIPEDGENVMRVERMAL